MDRLSVDDCQGAPCQAEFVSDEEVWTVLMADTDTDAHTVNHKSLGMERDDGERNILMIAVDYSYWMTSISVVVVVVVVACQCSLPYLLPVDDAVQVWMGRFTIGGFILPSWWPMVEESGVVKSRKSSRGSRRVGQSFIKRRLYFFCKHRRRRPRNHSPHHHAWRQACTIMAHHVTQTSPS
jgi:hypothetical protein